MFSLQTAVILLALIGGCFAKWDYFEYGNHFPVGEINPNQFVDLDVFPGRNLNTDERIYDYYIQNKIPVVALARSKGIQKRNIGPYDTLFDDSLPSTSFIKQLSDTLRVLAVPITHVATTLDLDPWGEAPFSFQHPIFGLLNVGPFEKETDSILLTAQSPRPYPVLYHTTAPKTLYLY